MGAVGAPTHHSTGCIHVGVLQGRALVHDVGAAFALSPGADVGSRAQWLNEIFLLIRHDHPVLQEGTQGSQSLRSTENWGTSWWLLTARLLLINPEFLGTDKSLWRNPAQTLHYRKPQS